MSDFMRRSPSTWIGGVIVAVILIYAGWRVIVNNNAMARRDFIIRQIWDTREELRGKQDEILRKQDEMSDMLRARPR